MWPARNQRKTPKQLEKLPFLQLMQGSDSERAARRWDEKRGRNSEYLTKSAIFYCFGIPFLRIPEWRVCVGPREKKTATIWCVVSQTRNLLLLACASKVRINAIHKIASLGLKVTCQKGTKVQYSHPWTSKRNMDNLFSFLSPIKSPMKTVNDLPGGEFSTSN